MLTLKQIEKYYPVKIQAFKRNILREYLQYKILEIIFNSKISKKLSFLGGTALRMVHGNTRFSEDLDFDNFGMTEKDFSYLSKHIEKKMIEEGYVTEINNTSKGAYRCKVKFPKILFDNELSGHEDEKIMIQIDSVDHKFDYKPKIVTLNKFDIFTEIFVTPLSILLSQKIYASLNRKRAKGRDFYDIIFLLGLIKPNLKYLDEKLGIKDYTQLKEKMLNGIKEFDFKQLSRDVQPFIFDQKDAKRVESFTEYFKEYKFI